MNNGEMLILMVKKYWLLVVVVGIGFILGLGIIVGLFVIIIVW